MVNSIPAGTPPLPGQTMDVRVRHCPETLSIKCCKIDPKIYLRTGVQDKELQAVIGGILKFALPEAGIAVTGNNTTALSTGPDEWLLITSVENHNQLLKDIGQLVLSGHFLSCHDASSATTCIQLHGQAATNIFSIATEANMNPEIFLKNNCACIRFLQCSAIVHRVDVCTYNIYVPRSYAGWIWQWLGAVTAT